MALCCQVVKPFRGNKLLREVCVCVGIGGAGGILHITRVKTNVTLHMRVIEAEF